MRRAAGDKPPTFSLLARRVDDLAALERHVAAVRDHRLPFGAEQPVAHCGRRVAGRDVCAGDHVDLGDQRIGLPGDSLGARLDPVDSDQSAESTGVAVGSGRGVAVAVGTLGVGLGARVGEGASVAS